MAPFYSTLAMWVGGTILVAMLKVSISESSLKGMKKVRDYQVYFGRYIVFLLIGLAQSTLIGLGDLLYLRIQCEAPFLFMLACWITSLVVCKRDLYPDRFLWRCRKSHRRYSHGHSGSRLRRHLPDRSCAENLPVRLSAHAVRPQYGSAA